MGVDVPLNEQWRLEELRGLRLLDTPAEERFDRLAELASVLLEAPIGLVSLVDTDRQWFKARFGLDATETERDVAFCAHAILDDDGAPFIVEDTLLDSRFADNPLVVGDPRIRFYAGQVIHSPGGAPVGTLCVIDQEPRRFGEVERRVLGHLAALVEQEFERQDLVSFVSRMAESEGSKRLILETLTEGLLLQDLTGRIVEWNPSAERVLGLPADQLAGRSSIDERWRAVHTDLTPWPSDTHPAMEALRTGRPVVDSTMGVHRPDGTLAWLRVNSTPVRDTGGAVVSVLTVFADVTAEIAGRARTEELEAELRLSELTARVSLDGLDHGVVLMDPSGTVHRMNAAAERILGYDAAELTEKWRSPSWTTYDESGAELPVERRPITIAMATGEPVSGQVIVWRLRDGKPITLRVSVTPVNNGSGQMVVGLADITAERTAVAQFRSAFDDAPIGMVIVDADTAIVEANSAFAALTGRSDDTLVGMQLTSLCHADDVADGEAAWTGLFRRQIPIQLDQRFIRPDDSVVRVSVHTSPVGNEIGPAFAIAQVLDVTEQHRHEAELAHMATHDPLTGLVNRRAFESALNEHVERCQRYGDDGIVMVLDLDNFKQINDTYGHGAGDRVIVSTAEALTRRLRTSDVVCRLGGDEFALLLPTGDIEQGRTVATGVLESLRRELAALGDIAAETAASIGVAAVDSHGCSVDELLANADIAMYDAKEAGGDRFAVFAHDCHDRPGPRSMSCDTWISHIERALEHDRSELLTQPQPPSPR